MNDLHHFINETSATKWTRSLGQPLEKPGENPLLFCSSRCTCTRSFLAFRAYHFLVLLAQSLLQRIHGGSFDRKSLFVTFHEGREAMNVPLIGSYCLAIVRCKDFRGEIGF